jgi:hypothetical protein
LPELAARAKKTARQDMHPPRRVLWPVIFSATRLSSWPPERRAAFVPRVPPCGF